MATKEIVVNLRLTDGDAISRLRSVKGALVDVKDEVRENNKALRENIAAIKAVEKAQKEGKLTTEQAAVSLQLLTNEREKLKRTSADLSAAEAGLSAQQRELRNEVGGLTEAGLRFRDKMAEASLEALKQSGILGQLETRTQALKDEQEKANQEFKDGVITQQQYDDVLKRTSTELVTVEQKEKMLREEVDRLNREFKEGVISTDQYKQELGRLGQAQDKASGSFAQFFGGINDGKSALTGLVSNYIGIGAAVYGAARAIGSAITMVKDFDQQLANVSALGGEYRKNIDVLGEAAISLGVKFGIGGTESLKAVEALAKAGISSADILGGALEGALTLSAAGTIELSAAAEIASKTMTQFNLEGSQMAHIADLLAAGANKATGDVADFGAALNQSGQVANQFGVPVEEAVGALTAFANAGLIGSDAGTSFRTMLIHLAKPTEKSAELMEQLGINAFDAQGKFVGIEALAGQLQDRLSNLTEEQRNSSLATIFGTDAIRAASVLYNEGAVGVRTWTEAVDDAGFAAKVAAEKLDTVAGETKKAGAAWEAFVLSVDQGDGILSNALKGIIGGFGDLLNLISGNGPGQKSIEAFTATVQKEFTKLGGVGELLAEETDPFIQNLRISTDAAKAFGNTLEDVEKLTIRKERAQAQASDLEAKALAASVRGGEKLTTQELLRLAASRASIAALEDEIDKRYAAIDATEKSSSALGTEVENLGKATVATRELTAAEKERAAAAAEAARLMADAGIGPAPEMAQGTGTASVAAQAPADNLGASLATGADPATILAKSQSINDQLLALQIEFEEKKTITFGEYLIRRQELENEAFGLEAQAVRDQAEIDGVITKNEALAILDAEFKAGVIKTEEELAAKRAAINKAYVTTTAQQFANLFDALSNLAQEGSAEQKALAIVGALINTYLGVTQALANLPPPASYVAAAVSLVSGLAAVKKISGFEEGGFTERARSNKKAVGVVHANEWVAPAHMVNDPNTGRVIDWLEYVRRGGFKRPQIPQQLMNNGFEVGGFTSFSSSIPRPSISELLSASSTAELRAKEFTAQISVSEINNVQNRVEVTEQLSTA